MCAKFHPTEDLVISASLDNTIRIWDISALRKKHIVPAESSSFQFQANLIGDSVITPKFILTVNDGVNWACFHPTLPLAVSASDDRQIKLWRYNEVRAWEIDTFRGHYNNVSCCAFHPSRDVLISCAEDKTLRIWDIIKRTLIYIHRRENDRFWMVAAHPNRGLIAAGHDSGFIIFKLEKERPCFCVFNNTVFYIRGDALQSFELQSGLKKDILSFKGRATPPRKLEYNQEEAAFLVTYEGVEDCHEVYIIKDIYQGNVKVSKSAGSQACWANDSCFAVLDSRRPNTLALKTIEDKVFATISSLDLECPIEAIFPAAQDHLFLRCGNRIYLLDIRAQKVVAEAQMPEKIKFSSRHVSEESGGDMVAFMGEKSVLLCTMSLKVLCAIEGKARVKSGVWTDKGVFFFTVTNHIMYLLPNGDSGIVRTLNQSIYLIAVVGNKIYCFDRSVQNRTITVDDSEILFKDALRKQSFKEAFYIAKSGIPGQSIVTYLQQKKYPELALCFAQDPRERFTLSLTCGDMDKAYESACEVDQIDFWQQLALASSKRGRYEMAEQIYKRINDYENLFLLYMAMGQSEKLRALSGALKRQGDVAAMLHLSFVTGDIASRVEILEQAGIFSLAYLTASVYGLSEKADEVRRKVERDVGAESPSSLDVAGLFPDSKLLIPPSPIKSVQIASWPVLTPDPTLFDELLKSGDRKKSKTSAMLPADDQLEFEGAFEDDGLWEENARDEQIGSSQGDKEEDDWQFDKQELPVLSDSTGPVLALDAVELPEEGLTYEETWELSESAVPVDHVAAGAFKVAMDLLNKQLGVVHFEPLKLQFIYIALSSHAFLRLLPSTPVMAIPLVREIPGQPYRGYVSCIEITGLIDLLQLAYSAFSLGKFQDALDRFRTILQRIPLLYVNSAGEFEEVQELISICVQYLLCLSIELNRRELSASDGPPSRISELTYHFANCSLNSQHQHLVYRLAMNVNVKLKNYARAEFFAQKLLYTNPKSDVVQLAQKVISFCKQNGSQDLNPMDHDEKNPSVLCAKSFKPIYKGTPYADCPYCHAHYSSAFAGQLCSICELSEVGYLGATGLVLSRMSFKREQI
ncbi:uncharacterized protein LOC126318597 [Schistocerca gregaria]|uniref:uncharacterized protein LOC126318597 n=1 Tax=Schistocerca gregaria TaxID=7010 RepID=UPI00211ECD53|nr:uncharacterized protein LOC126318597 [Schistocerca gregaria]